MADRSPVPSRAFNRNSLAVIAVFFLVVFALSQVAIYLLEVSGHLDWLMTGTATITAFFVDSLGIPVVLSGKQLLLANHILQIDLDCTGLTIASLYVALVIAYPLSARNRFLAIAAGLPVIVIANFARLIGVAFASEYLEASRFKFVHDYLFMVFMMLVVIGLWATWLQIARTRASQT